MVKARSNSISFTAAWNPMAEFGLLIAVTLLAGCLRFFRLGEWSLWGDEIFSLGNKPDGFIQSTTSMLIHWATGLLGTSEWSARLVPALIGTLSIPLLYFPIRKLFGVQTAMLSAVLLAVSPWAIYWSQNARFYVLLLLFYTLALLTFFIGLEQDRPVYLIVSLVFFGLAAKERMLALVFLPVSLVYLICMQVLPFERPAGFRLRNLAIYYGPLILLGVLFAWPFLLDIPGWLRGFSRINTNPFWLFSGTVYYVGLPVVIIAATGAVYFLRKRSRAVLYLSLGAVIPLAVILVSSLFQYSANRYAFVSLTSWILLAAIAAVEMLTRLSGSLRIFAVGLIVILLASSLGEDILYFQYQNGNRENWKAAFEFIQEKRRAGELVVIDRPEIGNYYLSDGVISYRQMDQSDILQHERVWFIEDMNVAELFPEQLAWVKANAYQVADFDVQANARLFKMRVYLFENSTDSSP
jgi:mannosyltransferase